MAASSHELDQVGMGRKKQVSIQDVAQFAEVSPQTVSRVVNDSTAVRPHTRQKVLNAMEALGYRPNYAARALKHGRFNNIGIVLFNITTFGNARILDGAVEAASEFGYAATVHIVNHSSEITLADIVEQMKQLPVDGVIVVLEQRVGDFDRFRPSKELPVVLITEKPSPHCPTIDADQYGCSTSAVEYLLKKGHRTVYHISGPSTSRAAESRAKGWRDVLQAHGIPVPPTYIGDWEADSGYEAGRALAHEADCTAIYAANDQMAYGAIEGLKDSGKRVPEDVSVIGVDDSLIGTVPRLSLTTMRMDFETIGREAFAKVKLQCEGEYVPTNTKTLIPAKLIQRGSVSDISQRRK